MRVEVLASVTGELAEQLWELYFEAFAPLATLASARHLLTREELAGELADGRIDKIVGFDDDGSPLGFLTRTRDLDLIPWISADAYRARFPEQFATGRLYFLPIMAMSPRYQGQGYGIKLVERMFAEPAAVGGVVAWDYSNANAELQNLVDRMVTIANRVRPARLAVLDTQTYYALDFTRVDEVIVLDGEAPGGLSRVPGETAQGLDFGASVSASDGGTAAAGGPGRP